MEVEGFWILNNDVPTNFIVDTSSLTEITHDGLFTGKLGKIGEFVKSWKVRHFSLNWKSLSYFEPTTLVLIGTIPLCVGDQVVIGDTTIPYQFKLVSTSTSRTYCFQTDDLKMRSLWCKNLNTLLRMHEPSVMSYPYYAEVTYSVAILVNLRKTLAILFNTHFQANQIIKEVFQFFFNLMEYFTYSLSVARNEHLKISADALKKSISTLKQTIPLAQRYNFEGELDISVEQRKIDRLLDIICVASAKTQIGREFTDDIKPFLISLVQQCNF